MKKRILLLILLLLVFSIFIRVGFYNSQPVSLSEKESVRKNSGDQAKQPAVSITQNPLVAQATNKKYPVVLKKDRSEKDIDKDKDHDENEEMEERERREHGDFVEREEEGEENDMYDGPQMAAAYEFKRTKDPATGKVPRERLLTAIDQTTASKEAMRVNSTTSTAALSWIERGPNSDAVGPSNGNTRANSGIASGRIRAVMVDSTDATHKTVWIGGVDGGLWKTTDITLSPATWTVINDNLSNLAVAAICQDPRPGFQNIMYFCTGESYYNVDAVQGNGVFKSTDGGATWNYLASTSTYVNCTRILCDFQGNIYLATRGTGLLRSTAASGGAAWTNITPSGLASDICDMEISSTSAAGRLHVVSGIFSTQAYRYTDIPATVTAGTWTAPAAAFPSFAMRAEIACSGSTLYALPANLSYQVPTIYKSTNGGANWAATPTQPGGGTWASGQGWYALAVDIDPSNANNCIIGGLDTYKTTDGGATWAQISTWVGTTPVNQYVHADVHKIVWFDGGNKLLFACDGGLHYSADKGTTIRDRNVGLRIKQFYSVAIHPATTNYFLAGAQDNGTHQFNNAGLSSTVEVTGGDGAYTAIDQNEPQYQFGSYVYNQYRRSINSGASWSSVNLSSSAGQFINPFDYDNTANIMYCGDAAGAYRRWTNPQTGSTSAVVSITALSTGSVTAVSVSPYTANRVYLGTDAGRVVIVDAANTIASGSAGTSISTGLPAGNVACVNQGTTDNNLMMCESNYGIQNVWVSTNGGTAWTAIDGNLPDMPVNWCMFFPGDNTKAYIATATGVWETTLINGASTVWTANSSFPTVQTDMIKYRPSDRTLAAATHGRGLWTTTIPCPTITVTNPVTTTGTVGTAFSQTFTQTGALGGATFTLNSGTLPTGLTLSAAGLLSGTPTQSGTFPLTIKTTDGFACTGTGTTYTLVISCQTISVTNPVTTTGTINIAFSQTFAQAGALSGATFSVNTGTLPTGLTLSAAGLLSGTPTQSGTFSVTIKVTDGNGCTGIGATYNLVIAGCATITVTNPVTTTGTANAAFSQTFTQTGAVGGATFTLNSGTLPTGLTLSTAGVLSGTPTQTGSFPITVKVTDGNTCTGTGSTYTLVISCQTITVTNPGTATGIAGVAFSQTFTQAGAVGGATFSLNTGTLPTGLTLSGAGVLSGTPTQTGSFPLTIKVTDGNGCTGTGVTYTLVISCQTITVTNPVTTAGTANAAFSQTFTQTGAVGGATFSINTGTLPTGLTLSSAGVLSGTPTQTGSFPITVKVTGGNACIGTGGTYTLVISCQTITVTNPVTATGTAGVAFSQTFTQSNSIGATTFSLNTGTLPTGLTLSSAGVLSGTPTQTGSFPLTIKVTDGNGCTGTGVTYTLVISCQTITVTNPVTTTGTANAAFSQTFTQTGAVGGATFSINTGTLPTGLTLSSAGVLSGTPTQTGSFPITVKVTGGNACIGTGGTYTLVISCQTITVTNPVTATGTAGVAFSQTFTQSNSIGATTFSLNTGTLPTGLTLSAAGVLSGTPTQTGSFPLTIKVTDANGCIGTGVTYTLVISCQTITVTNPVTATGTAGVAFSQTFTQTGAVGGATFSINTGTLPTGLTLSSAGVLSGTPTQTGSFPITVKVTGGNACIGTGGTYTLVISCQTITVTNPVTATGTAGVAFSQTFTQTGAVGGATFSINTGTLPTGLTLSSAGVLSGTPTQTGSFPITVKVTGGNACIGTGGTYTLVISCQTITVTNPVTTTGTSGSAFSQTFTQTGAVGGATFTLNSGTLPTGLTLSSAGLLSGTPTQTGSFAITVKVTGGNGCIGTGGTYTLVISAPATVTLNLTLFLEGFYTGPSAMQSNLFDLGLSADPTATDNITVNLWAVSGLANPNPGFSANAVLHTNGTATVQFPAAVNGNSYYIAVLHRNSIETWSKATVPFTTTTSYNFSTALIKAYDDGVVPPMKSMGGSIFAFYAGDINEDGAIDGQDMNTIDNEVGFFGYNVSDVNGDGATDGQDMNFVDNNSQLGLFYARP